MDNSRIKELQGAGIDPDDFSDISNEIVSSIPDPTGYPLPCEESKEENIEPETASSSNLSLPINKSSSSRKSGAPKHRITIILELFTKFKKGKAPKKENLNAFFIRSVQRIILRVKNEKILATTSIAIDKNNQQQKKLWKDIKRLCKEKELETNIILNEFCRRFYSYQTACDIFSKLLELFYLKEDPSSLSKLFKYKCCESNEHDDIDYCKEKWNYLKMYLEFDYLRDFDGAVRDTTDRFVAGP